MYELEERYNTPLYIDRNRRQNSFIDSKSLDRIIVELYTETARERPPVISSSNSRADSSRCLI